MQIHNNRQADEQKQSDRKYLIALVVLCAIVNFYGLGRLPLVGPDEPRYAEVAREMYETGDWVTPRLGGINWFEKPALTYWLAAAGYKLFGVSEFAARFGIALMASAGILILYFLGKRIRSSRFGYLSAAALATCGLWPGFARGATFDMPLSVAMELALLSFFLWESRDQPNGKNLTWWVFSFSLGLAVLAKGLVGIVLPVTIAGLYLLLTRRIKIVLKPALLLSGIFIFLAVAAVWYAPVIGRQGNEFVNEFFIAHHFQRYLSNKYRHPQPFYFFFLVAFAGCFPWSFYLASSAWQSLLRVRAKFDRSEDRLRLFLWLWVGTPIIFFSFSGSKLPGYILPVFPSIALIIGLELEQWWADKEPKRMKLLVPATALLICIAALVIGLSGDNELGLNLMDAFKVATIAIIVAIVYLALWFFLSGRTAIIYLPFGLALVVVATVNIVFPPLGKSESLRELSLLAKDVAHSGERLVFYVIPDYGINFYATDLPLRDKRSELMTAVSLDNVEQSIRATGGTSMLIASQRRWLGGLNETSQVKLEKLGEQKRNLSCSPDCDWVLLRAQLRANEQP